MELKILPIFSPKFPSCPRPATEIRFSRWNNANAQKFIHRERAQKEIEDDIRRERRYQSAANIAENYDYATDHNENSLPEFRSFGTPSSPSLPSIPGKASKYSRNPNKNPRDSNPKISHPAFRRFSRVSRIPPVGPGNGIVVSRDGVSYRVPNAPFEFQYSYTETPKVKPLALREPPYAPFGPATMPRPWTGRAPLPPSKKKLPEFDSFRLPPPGKKGVKPVQAPGPFLQGSGPKYVKSREEILGEPLTEEEKKELIKANLRTRRQLNMGRDGLTHNMLDNIHALWKRRRVCKIKCKGVCTVDMDNVRQQLEEKTGGKVIYSRGGVIFLFRGRNYNFRTRPKFPLMLWKPVSPVYPRLIQRAPEGLTLEEASNMRKRGRKLSPICKLGKNGVYCDLVKNVREAFEECELVRVNCEGMNKSDYKKIGAKLKDLVPCVLFSFEYEHILMWRGRDWKSSLPKPEEESDEATESTTDGATCSAISGEHQEISDSVAVMGSNPYGYSEMPNPGISFGEKVVLEMKDGTTASLALAGEHEETPDFRTVMSSSPDEYSGMPNTSISMGEEDVGLEMKDSPQLENSNQILTAISGFTPTTDGIGGTGESSAMPNDLESCTGFVAIFDRMVTHKELAAISQVPLDLDEPVSSSESSLCHCQVKKGPNRACTEGVLLLRRQAIESGSALFLDDDSLDANVVFERAIALAKTAPPEPTFTRRVQKDPFPKVEKQESEDSEVEEIVSLVERRVSEKNGSKNKKRRDFTDACPDVVPHGSLRVDELAKLLA